MRKTLCRPCANLARCRFFECFRLPTINKHNRLLNFVIYVLFRTTPIWIWVWSYKTQHPALWPTESPPFSPQVEPTRAGLAWAGLKSRVSTLGPCLGVWATGLTQIEPCSQQFIQEKDHIWTSSLQVPKKNAIRVKMVVMHRYNAACACAVQELFLSLHRDASRFRFGRIFESYSTGNYYRRYQNTFSNRRLHIPPVAGFRVL